MSQIFADDITIAAECLKRGGIVAYPTETVYGLGCNPWNEEACSRIQTLKQRSERKPMLLVAYSVAQVEYVTGKLDGLALKLANKFWPGPLTIVIKPKPDGFPPVHLLGLSGGIALRVTSHPTARKLAELFGKPIVSTSANIAEKEPPDNYEKAKTVFGDRIDFILKSEEITGGKASTVVDITSGKVFILREGALPSEKIYSFMEKNPLY